ncbi:MAG: response regulator [Armatimonadetes bacterium]|nr:response regulator [Armatimonadota bacterium]
MTRPARVLAVDDHPATLLLLKKALEPAGLEVREARSGAEALAVAKEVTPDLMLLDMHLPDMHGLEVLRRLRESAWGAPLKVVAMSALAPPDDQERWMRAGCIGIVEKPIDPKTLARVIASWLQGAPALDIRRTAGEAQPHSRLGEILVENLFITPEQLERAIQAQTRSKKRLGQILVEHGDVTEDDIAWALSNQLGYPYVYLTHDIIDEDAARLLPEAFLRERRILPVLKFGLEMTLAMADPTDQRTIDEVVGRTKLQVRRALALASNIEEMLDTLFTRHGDASEHGAAAEVQYLQFHLAQALKQNASEIHFDPAADGEARVRYRLQGVLVDRAGQPAELHAAILRHLRALTKVGGRSAGTGTALVPTGKVDIYLAAAFASSVTGPAGTVTIYPQRTEVPGLAPLGILERLVRPLRDALGAMRGVVMVGCIDRVVRSTLLHALIAPTHRGKMWALETVPIYRRATMYHTILEFPDAVPEHIAAAAAARADLILVDDAAQRNALVAAHEVGRARVVLAGHPQDDVVGLLSQVVEAAGPALVASTLRGILAARAIRLLCPTCKSAAQGSGNGRKQRTFIPGGCDACGFTGYQGLRVLTEACTIDPETRSLLRSGQLTTAYERISMAVGSQIRDQGLALLEDGLTSLEELAAVVDEIPWTSLIS